MTDGETPEETRAKAAELEADIEYTSLNEETQDLVKQLAFLREFKTSANAAEAELAAIAAEEAAAAAALDGEASHSVRVSGGSSRSRSDHKKNNGVRHQQWGLGGRGL